jgi:hypothetical protein
MLSVILLLIFPTPANCGWHAMITPEDVPKQPGNPVNVVLNDPRSTKRYSTFALQLRPKAHSAPPPTVQPVFVMPLPLKFHTGQVVAVQGGDPGGEVGAKNPVADAKLSTSTRP